MPEYLRPVFERRMRNGVAIDFESIGLRNRFSSGLADPSHTTPFPRLYGVAAQVVRARRGPTLRR